MRRTWVGLITVVVGLTLLGVGVMAQEGAQIEITSPRDGAEVRGVVVIQGSASHPDFDHYELYYAHEPNPNEEWFFFGQIYKTPVVNGPLATWDTTQLPDGLYGLQLRVVKRDGNYDLFFVHNITIANAKPTPTPTPEATPTPAASPTPLPPTPTVIVEQPPTATPRPIARKTPGVAPSPTPTAGVGDLKAEMATLRKVACYGSQVTLLLFVLVGVLVGLRGAIGWGVRRAKHEDDRIPGPRYRRPRRY